MPTLVESEAGACEHRRPAGYWCWFCDWCWYLLWYRYWVLVLVLVALALVLALVWLSIAIGIGIGVGSGAVHEDWRWFLLSRKFHPLVM